MNRPVNHVLRYKEKASTSCNTKPTATHSLPHPHSLAELRKGTGGRLPNEISGRNFVMAARNRFTDARLVCLREHRELGGRFSNASESDRRFYWRRRRGTGVKPVGNAGAGVESRKGARKMA